MKYCSHCGAELVDETEICPKCGCRVSPDKSSNNYSTLGTVAKVFMILEIVAMAIAFLSVTISLAGVSTLPEDGTGDILALKMLLTIYLVITLAYLCWTVPMTVVVFRRLKNNQPIGIALKVCTLIFVNVISGILLLCMKDDTTTNAY